MIELLPSLIGAIGIGFFLSHRKGEPVLQVFVAIVAAYVVICPAVSFLLSPDAPLRAFAYHQALLTTFFIFPLLFFLAHGPRPRGDGELRDLTPVRLSLAAPVILLLSIMAFAFITVRYNLYLVRLNYTEYNVTTDAPTLYLAVYRLILESSFFVILFLFYCIKSAIPSDTAISFYKILFVIYLIVFGTFFFVNSRMQFLTLLILLGITAYKPGTLSNKQAIVVIGSLIPIAISITIVREILIEHTHRLDASGFVVLLRDTILLISDRLNSTVMVDQAGEYSGGFNPFSIDLSGLWYFIQLNTAFFTDPELYANLREAQITSPSVYMINSMTLSNHVDFPKAMIVDVFLTFGVYGLPFLAYLLASIAKFIQRTLRFRSIADPSFVAALFVLPLLLQFEKEFLGFVSFLLKWSPMLVVALAVRPKRYRPPLSRPSEAVRA